MSEEIKNIELVSFLARHCHEDTRVYSAASVDAVLPSLKEKLAEMEKRNLELANLLVRARRQKKKSKVVLQMTTGLLKQERRNNRPIYSDGDDSVDWIG